MFSLYWITPDETDYCAFGAYRSAAAALADLPRVRAEFIAALGGDHYLVGRGYWTAAHDKAPPHVFAGERQVP